MNERRGRGSGRGGRGGSNGRGGGRGTVHTAHATNSYGSSGSDFTPEQWKAITAIINDGKSRNQSEMIKIKSNCLGSNIQEPLIFLFQNPLSGVGDSFEKKK